ncbi:hypothetical protein [Kocuria flava]|uniref:hypothetical protein n=1 Tax=Kocuria flava TaxID=446860 RepID=UPI002F941A72
MDDDAIGADQARRLHRGLHTAGLRAHALWLHYFRLGGTVNLLGVEAYLHHSLALPALQRDLLAQALAELTADLQVPAVPFTDDYVPGRPGGRSAARLLRTGAPSDPPAGDRPAGDPTGGEAPASDAPPSDRRLADADSGRPGGPLPSEEQDRDGCDRDEEAS